MRSKLLLTGIILLACSASAALAEEDELQCPSGEVKVCFTDGNNVDCSCRIRSIEMTDTPADTNECQDPGDTGICT